MKKKILAIVSHPDDEIIGCGGSLIKHVKQGDTVKVIFTSESEMARNKDLHKVRKSSLLRQKIALNISKILKFEKPIFLNFKNLSLTRQEVTEMNASLKQIIEKYKPSIIYTHTPKDIHHDHRKTFEATIIATKPQNSFLIKKILTFEIPSSTDCNFSNEIKNFFPNYFVNIKNEINLKIKILKKYKEEIKSYPNSRSLKGIANLNMYRGNVVSLNFAEAFELIRYVDYR
jgi:hypothetical protein